MRWRGREQSTNVEDRRSAKGPAAAGGGLLVVIIAVVMAYINSGGDVNQAIKAGANQFRQQQAAVSMQEGVSGTPVNPDEDEQAAFARVVLRDTEKVWADHFSELWQVYPQIEGKRYQDPILVLFRDGVTSACGSASAAVGPFYCPGDNRVYIDLTFFDEMKNKFGAPGDFACAYVIAHEVGHHIQNLIGLSLAVQREQSRLGKAEANSLSVRLELQADFLAGVWAHHAEKSWGILEEGDVREAINAANQIGDDTLMRKAGRAIRKESFTHGSSEQRMRWFARGLKTGDLSETDLLFQLPYSQL